MSNSHASQPEKHGAGSIEQASQVAVRDGNRLLCPCCGDVLMVLQNAKITEQAPHATATSSERSDDQPGYRADVLVVPIDPEVAQYEFPEENPPEIAQPAKASASWKPRPRMPKRPRRPRRPRMARRPRRPKRPRYKGPLPDAWSYESARFHAWVFYRMKALNLQLIGEVCQKQEQIEQLKSDLQSPAKQSTAEVRTHRQPLSQISLRRSGIELVKSQRSEPMPPAVNREIQPEPCVAGGTEDATLPTSQQRGPP